MPRPHSLTIRLTAAEHRALHEGARRLGTSTSDYLRKLIGDPSRAVVAHVTEQVREVPSRCEAMKEMAQINRKLAALVRSETEAEMMDAQTLAAIQRLNEAYG